MDRYIGFSSSFLTVLILSLAAVSFVPAQAEGTSRLTITSQDTSGNTITGYYAVLKQGGAIVATGFTPISFTLDDGVAYTVQVDSYGSCSFHRWLDTGSTSYQRAVSVSSDTTFTAEMSCSWGDAGVSVHSTDQNGKTITGYYTLLCTQGTSQFTDGSNSCDDDGPSYLSNGFTPVTFSGLLSGQTYGVEVENYGECSFSHWGNGPGATASFRLFDAESPPLVLTAVYYCGGAGTSQLVIGTYDQDGNPITGYQSTLSQNGALVATGATTATFRVNDGQTYSIQVSGTSSCPFDFWYDSGSTSPSREVSISSNTDYYAVMNCSGQSSTDGSMTVLSTNQNGDPISGYYTVLKYSPGNDFVGSGFTPTTFSDLQIGFAGAGYSLQAESYGSCTFSHWLDQGYNDYNDPFLFYARAGMTVTAVYSCG